MTPTIDTAENRAQKGPCVVVLQPCFFPWRGQFDLYSRADVRVFLDDVQFSRGTWFNRNKIMTASGPAWITVPIRKQGVFTDAHQGYAHHRRQPMAGQDTRPDPFCVSQNAIFLHILEFPGRSHPQRLDTHCRICPWPACNGVSTGLVDPRSFLCLRRWLLMPWTRWSDSWTCVSFVGARQYLSGPAARAYIGEGRPFEDAGIDLQWMEYPQYPRYREGNGEEMSVIDLLFRKGPEAPLFHLEGTLMHDAMIEAIIRCLAKYPLPPMIILDITNVCNLRCVHCPHAEIQSRPDFEPLHMRWDHFTRILGRACEL